MEAPLRRHLDTLPQADAPAEVARASSSDFDRLLASNCEQPAMLAQRATSFAVLPEGSLQRGRHGLAKKYLLTGTRLRRR